MATITLYDVEIDMDELDISNRERGDLVTEFLGDISSAEVAEILDNIGYDQPMDEDYLEDAYNKKLSTAEQKEFLSRIGAMEMGSNDLSLFTQLYDNLEDMDKVTFRENLDLADYGIDKLYENLTDYQKADFQVNHDLTTNAVYDELFSKVRHFFEVMRELNQVTKP